MYLSVLAIAQIIVSFIIVTVCVIMGILMIRRGIITKNKELRIKSYFTILGGCVFSTGIFWPAVLYLYTEHLWYEQLTYDSVFWKIINTHWWIFFEFALIAVGFMMLNVIIANRLCPLAKGFARWTKRGSLTVHITAAIFILILAALISAPMMLLWEDFLLYKEQVPVGKNEISIVDIEKKTVTALLTGQARPRGLAFGNNGTLYVAGSDQVFIFNRESGIFTTVVSELSGPRAIAIASNGQLYVAEADTGRVSIVRGSPATLEPLELKNERLSRPMSVVFGEGEVLYVAEADSGEVSRIDLNTGDVTTLAKDFSRPMSIAFDVNDKGLLYVAEAESGEISRLRLPYGPNADVEVHTMVQNLPRPIRSIVFDKDGFLYVAAGDEIYKIDASTLEPDKPKEEDKERLLSGLSNPMSLAFDAGGTLYVAEWGTGQISTVNTKNGNLERLPSEFARSVDLAFSDDGTMYVASDDEVFTADTTRRDFKILAKGLTHPKGLTVATQPEKIIYVSKDDKVFKVDTSTGEYTALAKKLKKPRGLAYDEQRGILYVAEFGSDDIMKIEDLSGKGDLKRASESIILSKKQRKERAKSLLMDKMLIPKDNAEKLLKRFEEGEDMFDEERLAEEKYIPLSPEEKKSLLSEEYIQDRELFKSLAEDLSGPMSVVLDKTGDNLYVAEWSTGEVSRVKVNTGIILKVASGLSSPKDLVYDSVKNLLYVAESGSGDISVINLNAEPTTKSILVGGLSSPTSLAFDRDKKLYMAESIDTDPIFNKDIGDYMFTYPIHKWVSVWIKALLWVTILFTAVMYNYYYRRDPQSMARARKASIIHFSVFWLMLLAVSIWRSRLNISELLLKQRYAPWASFSSKVYGMGSADIQQTLSYNIFMFIVIAIAAVVVFNMFWHKRFLWYTAVSAWVAGYVLIVLLYPALYQRLKVDPNKKIIEIPYIKHNINGTRKAYSLDKIKEERFIKGIASLKLVKKHPEILKNVQLWDRHVLYLTLRELEAYRDYYNFDPDTDVDRYWVENEEGKLEYRQLMLAAREVYPEGLSSKDWINTRFIYTHGYGVVVVPVNMYTGEGMPVMWINEIPPVVRQNFEFEKIRVPEIYFGELTKDYVFVKTRERELDYPQLSEEIGEEENKYTTYKGRGGILLGGGLRRLAFFWRFARLNVFLTKYLKEDSEVMFRRQIEERVRAAAPILKFDPDPFIVIGNSGKLWWVIDTYVINGNYPYSEPHKHPEYGRFNYIRNAAVTVVDAYNGDVNFYILEEVYSYASINNPNP